MPAATLAFFYLTHPGGRMIFLFTCLFAVRE